MGAPNSAWAARGAPMAATEGCGKFNVYVSTLDAYTDQAYSGSRNGRQHRSGMDRKPRKIDVRCMHCGRRVKFQWSRGDNRGRPRPVSVMPRPETMPRKALVQEMQARNRLNAVMIKNEGGWIGQTEYADVPPEMLPGFVRASELV